MLHSSTLGTTSVFLRFASCNVYNFHMTNGYEINVCMLLHYTKRKFSIILEKILWMLMNSSFSYTAYCWHFSIPKYIFITALTFKLVKNISFTAFGSWTLCGSKVCNFFVSETAFISGVFDSSLRCSTVCLTVLKCLPYCTFKINCFSFSFFSVRNIAPIICFFIYNKLNVLIIFFLHSRFYKPVFHTFEPCMCYKIILAKFPSSVKKGLHHPIIAFFYHWG